MKKTIYVLVAIGVIALLYLKPWATAPDSTEGTTDTTDTTIVDTVAPVDTAAIVDTAASAPADTTIKEGTE